MKIDAATSIYSVERYRTQASKVAERRPVAMPDDKVDISTEAASFAEVFSAAKSSMTEQLRQMNPAVEAVKRQVAEGTYSVNADDVASSILLFT